MTQRFSPRLLAAFARLRFRLAASTMVEGDLVETLGELRYRGRVDRRHLPWVPAGQRARVLALGPMPRESGGALIELLDGAGDPSGYWTGAPTRQLRRIGARREP